MASSTEALVADAEAPTGRFPGWRVVAGCFIVLTVSSGLGFYGFAVYLNAFSNEQGWPLGQISLATTVFFVVGGFVGVLAARAIADTDVRWVISGGAVVGGGALALLGQALRQEHVVFAPPIELQILGSKDSTETSQG
jgi:hypothetical protein